VNGFKRPQRSARRRPLPAGSRRWFIGLTLALALLAAGSYLAVRESSDPRFAASIGEVTGISHTSRAQVIRAAALASDQNAWLIRRRAVSGRIERLPWVLTAKLSVRWPNKVRIDITERKPAAYVVLAVDNGEEPLPRYALVDERQRVLWLTDNRSEAADLPLLIVTPPPSGNVQAGSSLTSREVGQALQALTRLRDLGLQVSQVAIAPATGISALADRHLRVLFGEDEDLAKKAAVFQAIVAKISAPDQVAYIDVRSVKAPTVLYR
jgi:cell division septal protein FtsQ